MMPFLLPRIVRRDYIKKTDNSTKFIFPITGLNISDSLPIGDVVFHDSLKIDYERYEELRLF